VQPRHASAQASASSSFGPAGGRLQIAGLSGVRVGTRVEDHDAHLGSLLDVPLVVCVLTLVTIPGAVFLLPDEAPQQIAQVIATALGQVD
jgi:hypothetical protein